MATLLPPTTLPLMPETVFSKTLLLIPGAQKSGTSALFDLLASSPVVSVPRIKEPQYFALPPDIISRHLDWYARLFPANDRPFALDASTFYFTSPTAPEQIARHFSNVVVLVVLRDPVNRTYSAFQHMRKNSPAPERRSFQSWCRDMEEFGASAAPLQAEERSLRKAANTGMIDARYLNANYLSRQHGFPIPVEFPDPLWPFRYLRNSSYSLDIPRWQAHFSDAVLVVSFESLCRDPSSLLRQVEQRVNASLQVPSTTLPRSNVTRLPRFPSGTAIVSRQFRPFAPFISPTLRRLLARALTRPPQRLPQPLAAKTRSFLQGEYERMATLLPHVTTDWST